MTMQNRMNFKIKKMNKKNIMGDGNKVAQPAQEMVATRNAQSEFDNFAIGDAMMVFVVEHEMIDCTDRSISKYHYFHNRKEAEKFRKHLIMHQLSKMNLTEYFEYRYDYTTDTSILIYVEMQSRFLVYRIKVSEPIEGIDQLSFEERVQSDDDYCERQEHLIPTNFLPF